METKVVLLLFAVRCTNERLRQAEQAGGAADARIGNKFIYSLKLSEHLKLPLINLVDGSGGGGSGGSVVRNLGWSEDCLLGI